MIEDDLREEVRKWGRSNSAHISWVESHATSPGFPDADICLRKVIIQTELKVVKAKGKVEIRPTQYEWFRERLRAGGKPVMLIGDDDKYYVVPARSVVFPSALTNIDQLFDRPHGVAPHITIAMMMAIDFAKQE